MKVILLLTLIVGILLTGCGESQQKKHSPNSADPEVIRAIALATSINESIGNQYLLTDYGKNQKDSLLAVLKKTRIGLIRLRDFPKDQEALKLLYQEAKKLDQFVIPVKDQAAINEFKKTTFEVISNYSQKLNLPIDELTWVLYSTNFATGLTPFKAYPPTGAWGFRMSQDQTMASIAVYRGPTYAWLITPELDLTDVKRPGFKIRHMIQTKELPQFGDDFSQLNIIQNAYTAWISTSYQYGDPGNPTDDPKNWTLLDLGKLPISTGWDESFSGMIDLAAYEGKKVVIGFFMNYNSDLLGEHIANWSIGQFELFGQSSKFSYQDLADPKDPEPFYQHTFSKDQALEGFSNINLTGEKALWTHFNFRQTYFAKIMTRSSDPKPQKVVLYTQEPIELHSNEALYFQIHHTTRDFPQVIREKYPELLQVQIAQVKDSVVDYQTLSWVALDGIEFPNKDFEEVKSSWIALPTEFQGKKIAIAFVFDQKEAVFSNDQKELAPTWQIYSFNIEEESKVIHP